jgi:hypothetical protein
MEQNGRKRSATEMGVRTMPKKEEYVGGMGQRKNCAAAKDVRIRECAKCMGHIVRNLLHYLKRKVECCITPIARIRCLLHRKRCIDVTDNVTEKVRLGGFRGEVIHL